MTNPVILFAPVPSSRTTPALLTRFALVAGAVPFGQWNVCNALWAPPDFGQPGRLWIGAKLLEFLRSAAISGPLGPSPVVVSRVDGEFNCEAATIDRAVEVAGSFGVKQPVLRFATVCGGTPERAGDG